MLRATPLQACFIAAVHLSALLPSVHALPLGSSTTVLPSSNHLQARAPCGDHCDDDYSTTTTPTCQTNACHPTATPVPQMCTPSFQGAAVRVSTSGSQSSWCILAAPGKVPATGAMLESIVGSGTTFRLEQTGYIEQDFIIKLGGIGNNSVILTPMDDGLGLCDLDAAQEHSRFKIVCNTCRYEEINTGYEEMATGCSIMSYADNRYMSESNGRVTLVESSRSSSYGGTLFDIVAHDPELLSRRVKKHDACDPCEEDNHEVKVKVVAPPVCGDGVDCFEPAE